MSEGVSGKRVGVRVSNGEASEEDDDDADDYKDAAPSSFPSADSLPWGSIRIATVGTEGFYGVASFFAWILLTLITLDFSTKVVVGALCVGCFLILPCALDCAPNFSISTFCSVVASALSTWAMVVLMEAFSEVF
ncbi:hypothetical protein SUGI_0203450 [Cryptomeria japonica]|nr:hypothetical protein SUGI_0203450 [Cryptomeria japonica]